MNILSHIEIDIDNKKIKINKWLQFITISQKKVYVYTTLLFSDPYKNTFPSISIQITLDNDPPNNTEDFGKILFLEENVLRKYWGKNCRLARSRIEISEQLKDIDSGLEEDTLNELRNKLYSEPGTSGLPALLFGRKNDDPLIAIPDKSKINESGNGEVYINVVESIKPFIQKASDGIRRSIIYGVSICSKFKIESYNNEDRSSVHHSIVWKVKGCKDGPNRLELRADDIQIYYSIPSEFDIKNYQNFLWYSKTDALQTENDRLSVSLVKECLPSDRNRDDINPFDIFREHSGTNESTIFKIDDTHEFRERFSAGKAQKFDLDLTIIDPSIEENKKFRNLLISIWMAAIMALGIDGNRIKSIRELFPNFYVVNETFWWFFMCASIVPFFMPPVLSKSTWFNLISTIFGLLSFFLLIISAVVFFFLKEEIVLSQCETWSVWFVYLTIISGIITLIFKILATPRGMLQITKKLFNKRNS